MKYPLLAQSIYNVPWLLTQDRLQMVEAIFREHLSSGRPLNIAERLEGVSYGQEAVEEAPPQRVALVNMHGTLMNRAGLMEMSGGLSPQTLERKLRALADDSSVSEIVVSADSPGGEATNTDEAGRAMRYAASKKPVTLVVNGMLASGAYWIGAQATKIVTTPLSQVGSIGAYIMHADISRMLENQGVDLRIYRTASMKGLGQLIDPHEGAIEEKLNALLSDTLQMFAAEVAQGRGMTAQQVLDRYALDKEGSLAGGVVRGEEAVRLGLADEVGSLNDVLVSAAERTSTRTGRRSRTTQMKTPHTKGRDMDPELLEELGLTEDATPDQVRAAIKAREQTAATRAKKEQAAATVKALGLEEGSEPDFASISAQASDGRSYRADLLDRLGKATIRAHGNDEAGRKAADRAKNVYATASIGDLREQVEELEAKVEADVPGERQSKDKSTKPARSTRPARY